MVIPNNIQIVLKKLKKSHSQVATECLSEVVKTFRGSGYTDAQTWAKTTLQSLLGDLAEIESDEEFEAMASQLDGCELEAMESFYKVFSEMRDQLGDLDPADVKDALVYSLVQIINKEDKKNYSKLYG